LNSVNPASKKVIRLGNQSGPRGLFRGELDYKTHEQTNLSPRWRRSHASRSAEEDAMRKLWLATTILAAMAVAPVMAEVLFRRGGVL
jgi:hypothetical protein